MPRLTRQERLERLRRGLAERRDELRMRLLRGLEPADEAGHGDVADAATYNTASDLDTRMAALESDELHEIEMALSKFRDGRYGVCELSGKSIPIERLEALPFTRFSVEAQRLQEQLGHRPGREAIDWETAIVQESRMTDREVSIRDLREE